MAFADRFPDFGNLFADAFLACKNIDKICVDKFRLLSSINKTALYVLHLRGESSEMEKEFWKGKARKNGMGDQ